MLQGDAIREITLEGPGAGGIETASAVIADMASVIGTMGTGFLQNDPVWRDAAAAPARRAPLAVLLPPLGRRPARACSPASPTRSPSARSRSRACSSTRTATARRCTSSRTRRAQGALDEALAAIAAMDEVHAHAAALPGRLRPRRRGARMGVIERYRDRLPVGPDDAAV